MSDTIPKRHWINLKRWQGALPSTVGPSIPLILMGFILWFVCFYNLGTLDLIDGIDEGLYASASRQMIDSGDWVTPRMGRQRDAFFDKPPLLYWCQSFFIRVFGPTPLAARLPSALAAFLTALTMYYWAKRRGAMRVGWVAATLFVLCPLVALGLARVAMLDSLLTFWFTLTVVGWVEGYGGNRKAYLLMAAAMGLATMTKGLIGFLLPSMAFCIWLIMRRDRKALGEVPWVAVLSVFLLLVLPWHVAAWWANGDLFLREYIVRQHFIRFLGQDFGHAEPFWYFLPVLALAMVPASAFVPIAWWRGLRGWRSERQSLSCAMAMWALWAVVVMLFFSVSRSKLPNYILPALPALVLLVAWRLDLLWQAKRGLSTFESGLLIVVGGVLGIFFLVVGWFGWQWRSQPASPSWFAKSLGGLFAWKEDSQNIEVLWRKLTPITELAPHWIALGGVLLLGSAMFLLFWRNTRQTVVSALSLSLALIILAVHFGMPAWINSDTAPINELGRRALPGLQRGEPLVLYALHPKRPSLRYTLGYQDQLTETFSPDVLQSVMTGAGHGYILTANDVSLPPLSGTLQQAAAAGRWALWRYDSDYK
jgi:4-amino-4-deoxy-L-arabinose transferase-like glycosyltransferase